MPLPLIPLIVAGAAAASAAVAGKKGYDSYQNMQETKEVAQSLESKYKKAYKNFELSRDETNESFEGYGLLKLDILNGSMKEFVESFRQIKNVDFKGEAVTDNFVSSSDINKFVINIEHQVIKAGQITTAGIASLAGGGLAALGAVGATTTFAAASTGTAIATLSGIVAQNATLAFLGGGALSAGGLGIAGGTLVLGGIALAPALAIGSLIFASTTEKNLEKMHEKKAEVNTQIEKLYSAANVMAQIRSTTGNMRSLAESTNKFFEVNIEKMNVVIQRNGNDFSRYTAEQQTIIHNNYKLAIIMRDILNTTILDEKGMLMPNIQSVITAEKRKVLAVKGY